MKKQIKKLSPHQNGKVFGLLMAVLTLPFLIPTIFMMNMTMPQMNAAGNPIEFPTTVLYFAPFLYLIFGYISVAIGSLFYNFICKFVGGFEFEIEEINEDSSTK